MKPSQTETPREVAGDIVARFQISLRRDAYLPLADAIEVALTDRDERAAKIAEDHFHNDEYLYHSNTCTKAIAAAIRMPSNKGESNAD